MVAWQIACYLRKDGAPTPEVGDFLAGEWLPGVRSARDRAKAAAATDTAARERKRVASAFGLLFARARAAAVKGR